MEYLSIMFYQLIDERERERRKEDYWVSRMK